jgi:hypothetical protein
MDDDAMIHCEFGDFTLGEVKGLIDKVGNMLVREHPTKGLVFLTAAHFVTDAALQAGISEQMVIKHFSELFEQANSQQTIN